VTDLFISVLLVVATLALGRWQVAGRREPASGILLMAWHLAWCLIYWQYAQSAVADATIYLAYGATAEFSFLPGTVFVNSLSVLLVRYLGFSDLNCFLAFNLPGGLGLILLRSALAEASAGSTLPAVRLARLLVWLPGLSFWSVAPGKDGLALMGAAAVTYAVVDRMAHWPWLVIGVGTMFMVRPHIAAVQLVMVLVAYLLGRRRGSRLFLGLGALAMVAGLMVPFALEYVGLGSAQGLEDITTYVEQRQTVNMGGNTSVDITAMNPVERLVTFMYRPLFFDAPGVTGLVASVENLIWLVFTFAAGAAAVRARRSLRGFQVRFSLAYLAAGWLVLANVTSNLGIAVRQKTMLLPSLLTLGVIALAAAGAERRRSVAGPRAWSLPVSPTAAGAAGKGAAPPG
jgi:hypothetical protein